MSTSTETALLKTETVKVPSTCAGCEAHRQASLARLGLPSDQWDYLVALAGNPNTGKSTVFNALTGLRQHTGNWPGKTVTRAEGWYTHDGKRMKIVDLPGTYSLQAGSTDEEVARDFILFGQPDVTVIVVDANRLGRNLNLVLQVLEITDRAVICLNLIDEAARHGVVIDHALLSTRLGVPVVPTVARRGKGIPELLTAVHDVATATQPQTPFRIRAYPPEVEGTVTRLADAIRAAYPGLPNARWVAFRLLNADERVEVALRTGELRSQAPEMVPPPEERDALLAKATSLRWSLPPSTHDVITEAIYAAAEQIANSVVRQSNRPPRFDVDRWLDRVVTSQWLGFPIMLVALVVVFWTTIWGANVPSQWLSGLLLDTIHPALKHLSAAIGIPWWIDGVVIDGAYLATAWVVSVMLPPMAIFFPLFTLLEDFGYLPRVAFNLDGLFRRAGAHGKQALTMCMGFGCNAAGVVATRIIDSPRERLIAIITNNFSLCNGRWPTQILIATIFIGAVAPANLAGLVSAGAVVTIALLGMAIMFLTSWLLSHTALRGEATTFSLELPPYRPPRILETLYKSLIDRTLIVLWRAVVFALPAGVVIWLVSNIHVNGQAVATHLINLLNPLGLAIGLNGVILLAYVVAIPANEIVIPTILMLTVLTLNMSNVGSGAGVMFELDSVRATSQVLHAGGWTLLTGVNLMLFSLLHNPCSTTLYTIYRETRSVRWTILSAALPVALGFLVCFVVARVWGFVT